MEILNIKLKTLKNSNIFLITTDEEEYELHSDIIVKYHLTTGLIDDNIFMQAKEESDILIASNLAMKYISSRLKTEQQIKDYLYKKEYSSKIVNAVVEKMKTYSIIDDKTYAEMYIKSNPNFSTNKLKQKLFGFGIKNDIIQDLFNDVDDTESCKTNAEKFFKNKPLISKTKEKLVRRLSGMGYNWETIKRVLNNFKFEEQEQ